jgi:AraC family transcriptional regulator
MYNPAPSPTTIDGETLAKLLVAASTTLDSDVVTAKVFIQRASDLLRGFREAERRQVCNIPAVQGGLAPWQQKRVAAYVEDNISANIRADDLAGVVRLSVGHFFRAFRQSFGEPPLVYVARRRIYRSQALMLSSGASLSQIALECGLSDQPHFTRVFRKHTGVTPGVWRRQFTNETSHREPSEIASRVRVVNC